jgi:hypothetical protein
VKNIFVNIKYFYGYLWTPSEIHLIEIFFSHCDDGREVFNFCRKNNWMRKKFLSSSKIHWTKYSWCPQEISLRELCLETNSISIKRWWIIPSIHQYRIAICVLAIVRENSCKCWRISRFPSKCPSSCCYCRCLAGLCNNWFDLICSFKL